MICFKCRLHKGWQGGEALLRKEARSRNSGTEYIWNTLAVLSCLKRVSHVGHCRHFAALPYQIYVMQLSAGCMSMAFALHCTDLQQCADFLPEPQRLSAHCCESDTPQVYNTDAVA